MGKVMSASPERIGRYQIKRSLGQGAMGTVYEALDPLIERVVAVKTINLNLSGAERSEFQSRFFREAKSAGRLNHPNIVTIYDVGETDEVAHIAMEFLTGQSLRSLLDSGVVLPMQLVRKIVVAIASALDYAHENGVVHRDIKPANVMIGSDYSVKIMDFGIAQLSTGSQTMFGTVLGSPKYMAPEQVAGRAVDGRSDIFSLGVVLYELLTARTPFDADNVSAIMYKVVHEQPAAPSTVSARVPQAFDAIVAKALAKKPEDRFQRAGEFAAALNRLDLPKLSNTAVASAAPQAVVARRANEATVVLTPQQLSVVPEVSAKQPTQPPKESKKATSAAKDNTWVLPAVLLGIVFCAVLVVALFSRDTPKSDQTVATSPDGQTGKAADNANTTSASGEKPTSLSDAKPTSSSDAKPIEQASVTAETAQGVAASQTLATVSLAVYPWGEVWVNGKNVGVSPPLNELKLKPGQHAIEIRNESSPPYRETFTLIAGEPTKRIRHKFQ
jgi:eukaryotic-like serine/threonine-protein kinase